MNTTERIWPARTRLLRLPWPDAWARVDLRVAAVSALLALVALAVCLWSLTIGELAIAPSEVLAALAGDADEGVTRVVREWRLPRALIGLLGGAALGASGAIFQSLTRNPLGSPDIIGFNAGAYTGTLLAALLIGGSELGTTAGALLGGIGTGLLVYVLAFRHGVQGYRLIVVGVGVSALLTSLNSYLLVNLRREDAIAAATWGAGSFNDVGWSEVWPVLIAAALLLPAGLVLTGRMRLLELGDDAARALGVPVERTRLAMLLVGIGLTAVVTAVAGPIAFVALVAPQLAMRLTRAGGVRLLPAAAMGALLLTCGDLIARTVIAPSQLPVGVVTVCLGGAYLVWLLWSSSRRGTA
ncbi:FecCD family ABC transporter permease [Streptomyces profundus]|uniref:FecCD family ABC transporter permease n=1 Tax=Streptomyces profundus TaxID=2867410 RepID=UPI001D16B01A|nr:iron chelate uptake ABC transporter family permease subunit [Streptomyces sp. MA3_2.13]UED86203.1 iron chelate uptake ABC transporter family permease subunit [Streptomyces sp. MA3_2.13]